VRLLKRKRDKSDGGSRPFARFTPSARDCLARAQEEARALGHNYLGTEHILMALAAEQRGAGGRALRSLGVTAQELREDVQRIIGTGGIDADALASIGIDLDEVRRHVEESFGPGALDLPPSSCREPGRIPFTPRSKKSLHLALSEAQARGDTFIGSEHLLLGIARVEEGVGARMLADRGYDRGRIAAAVDQVRRAA
jgi:ATP-dependent Clp protease ATP-binding subunit ClpA